MILKKSESSKEESLALIGNLPLRRSGGFGCSGMLMVSGPFQGLENQPGTSFLGQTQL